MNAKLALWPEARPLEGRFVRLEPYAEPLREELRAALDVDPDAWAVLATSGQGQHFDAWWRTAVDQAEARTRLSYAIRRLSDGALVGTTAYLNIRPAHRGVEVGGTFLRPGARGGAVNPEMKRLMLAHAFAAGAIRVELVTDARNLRSQAAILKLGAKAEGVQRRERITWTGHIRDTAVFAITDLDWPEVKAGLDQRLAGFQ
jgi:RimJ/RimL family protein N-acetyltransferase